MAKREVVVCDRCSAVLDGPPAVVAAPDGEYDLCGPCRVGLGRYLQGAKLARNRKVSCE